MTTETPYTLRDLATMVADQYPGLDWYHGAPEPGEETAAEWAASCTQPESRCDDLHVVWSDGGGKVIVQAIVGDTQNAAIRAAYFAQLAPADVLRLLDELDAANAKLAAAWQVARWVTDDDPCGDAQMIVDLIDGRCIGTPLCPAPTHEHGCFADRGNCDDPDDHPKEDQ